MAALLFTAAGGALIVSWTAALFYFGALCTSILIYRAFFHRLRKLYSLRWVLPHLQYYSSAEKLHEKYGEIVRTGPRELSIANVDAAALIHGPSSRCTKGPWYSVLVALDLPSLQSSRDKQEHKVRRKIWERAFNAKSLREYEPRLNRHTFELMGQLKDQVTDSVRITDWLNWYSFDVMGDIGFSHDFGMVRGGKEDELITKLHKGMAGGSIFGHLTWMINLLVRPGVGIEDIVEFDSWAHDVLKRRHKIQPREPDVTGWIVDPDEEDLAKHVPDTKLLIVAGSDTTSSTLAWLCYELCKNPAVQIKLRKILDAMVGNKAFLDVEDVANVPYLDGIINETMRLHPAVPSGVQRLTPPEGLTLPSGPYKYIPGNTIVWTHTHTLQRNADYFPRPMTFIPERWTDEMSATHLLDKRAFQPFSAGTYNCIGQKLAMMEMRSVVANLVRRFEIEFAEGEKGERIERDTQDCFTVIVGALDVRLTPRTAGKS
ncbi:cytochrome P450 [Clohesyomyces aquaticus]|uniref:Cytochrome P450 n=1 Tax=Clohesyomyces aquaticus TaxID=1231657 RepID=A0A1Y1YTJ7_9PLEO|nr:cytochrome P450 [Clohesyomyces aquaticus]